ncbi:hypothetical protein R1sor_020318 [Riccia sorocarpa]|uniref:Methenyltetrahydrofolate cyclohydrolase n=1 Tax=Riccia sorocarpa TaxID=122646 RepID=A0ABD3IJA6_9MARC
MSASAVTAALVSSSPCSSAFSRARFPQSTRIDGKISGGYVVLGSVGLLRRGWGELDEKSKRFCVGDSLVLNSAGLLRGGSRELDEKFKRSRIRDNRKKSCCHGGSGLHVSVNGALAGSEDSQIVCPPVDVVPSAQSTAEVIDGKRIAEDIRREIAQEVTILKEATGQVPGLAVVLVGNRVDSATYVRSKKKACAEVGFASYGVDLPEDATEEEVLSWVCKYNEDPAVHGILVQLPLPKHMNEEKVIGAVSVEKDVDGFHPLNVGKLVLQGRTPLFVSCTPKGCIELLLRSGVEIAGKQAVVIGRSNVVGMPAAILLQAHNATVTVVHSRTPNPAEITRRADIVIVAVGAAQLVRGDWIKPGAVVIDVGMNSLPDSTKKKGYRLVGDVCYPEAAKVASKITPVPGGVGPMTIAMLLQNTLDSAKRTLKL